MNCSELTRWMRENPGLRPEGELFRHAGQCPECRRLMDEHTGLERALRSLPAVEPPSFFETRIKAALARPESRPSAAWRPVLAPVIGLLLAAIAVGYYFVSRNSPGPEAARKPDERSAPAPALTPSPAPQALAAVPTAIYPVWPRDEDVVTGDDLSIMASLFPAPRPGATVSMALDEVDVSGQLTVEGELVSFSPKRMAPGRHEVTISLRDETGPKRSVTFSFYSLEVPS